MLFSTILRRTSPVCRVERTATISCLPGQPGRHHHHHHHGRQHHLHRHHHAHRHHHHHQLLISGDKLNNKRFSPCSLSAINRVLQVKARGAKGCFNEPQQVTIVIMKMMTKVTMVTMVCQALCGNGVVEEGEECDCGWEEDCTEECCW